MCDSGNNVDFAKTGAVVSGDDFEAFFCQKFGGKVFADLAGLPVIIFGHFCSAGICKASARLALGVPRGISARCFAHSCTTL